MSLRHTLTYAWQAGLPTRGLSSMMHRFMRSEWAPLRHAQIETLRRHFNIDLSEAERETATDYHSFNDFFTRALKPDARPLAPKPAIVSPVDGCVSQCGAIDDGRIFQAKGRSFTCAELLADENSAKDYRLGQFATIYLAPHNYHRIHMPCDARLLAADYVPGRLFSVNPLTAESVDRLFARNERLVMHFASDHGPFALVMVGALFVGSLETVVEGKISPPHRHRPEHFNYHNAPVEFSRGDELGRFNMGSTVILLYPPDRITWDQGMAAGAILRMGQAIASPQQGA